MLVYLRDWSPHTIVRAATTEIEVADQTFYLTQSQYTNTGPTSLSADPITPGAWQGSTGVPILKSLLWLDPEKKRDLNPGSSSLEADALTTRPTRRLTDGTHIIAHRSSPLHEVVTYCPNVCLMFDCKKS